MLALNAHIDCRPILAYFAGLCAKPHYTMGHSGAIKDSEKTGDGTANKMRAFREKGIIVLNHIGNIGDEMAESLRLFKAKKLYRSEN